MNPIVLLTISGSTKKYVICVLVALTVIVSLPMVAVLALGQSTLSFLSLGSGSGELYQGPLVATDTYAWGNCTYWAALLRLQAGDPIPNNWGNAATWAHNARLDGYVVDQTPSVGAIMQISDVDNGLGHVAYVESVDPLTGAWQISEMNVKGLDIIDTQTLPAAAANNYNFIHDKN